MEDADATALVSKGVTKDEAAAIALRLLAVPMSLDSFGPRIAALSVLNGVTRMVDPARAEDVRNLIAAHTGLVIVRPDGYLVSAISGNAIQRVGRPSLDVRGRFVVGGLEVGRFYHREDGSLREVGADLSPDYSRGILYELTIEHDVASGVLDGAEDAFIGLIRGLGDLIADPPRAIENLQKLPLDVYALIRNSPELWERFAAMPSGDQARIAGQIATTILTLYAGAPASGAKVSAATKGGLGAGGIEVSGGVGALAARWQLAFAGEAAGAGEGRIAVALIPGALAEIVELSDVARAGLKHAGRELSKEGEKVARAELPKIAAERERMLEVLERLQKDPRLSENARSLLGNAERALRDHLKPEDLIGALRDSLGVPVRRAGDGREFQHSFEVERALGSLSNARSALARDLVRSQRAQHEIAGLSSEIDAISAFARRAAEFSRIR